MRQPILRPVSLLPQYQFTTKLYLHFQFDASFFGQDIRKPFMYLFTKCAQLFTQCQNELTTNLTFRNLNNFSKCASK